MARGAGGRVRSGAGLEEGEEVRRRCNRLGAPSCGTWTSGLSPSVPCALSPFVRCLYATFVGWFPCGFSALAPSQPQPTAGFGVQCVSSPLPLRSQYPALAHLGGPSVCLFVLTFNSNSYCANNPLGPPWCKCPLWHAAGHPPGPPPRRMRRRSKEAVSRRSASADFRPRLRAAGPLGDCPGVHVLRLGARQ